MRPRQAAFFLDDRPGTEVCVHRRIERTNPKPTAPTCRWPLPRARPAPLRSLHSAKSAIVRVTAVIA